MYRPDLSASTMNSSKITAGIFAMAVAATPLLAQRAEPVLTARPGLCILERPEAERCVMALDLEWQSAVAGSYCLHYSLAEQEPLHCWPEATSGQHHSELSSREDVSYWLQFKPSAEHLAQIRIRVVSLAQRNPERRRRRHVWSVL